MLLYTKHSCEFYHQFSFLILDLFCWGFLTIAGWISETFNFYLLFHVLVLYIICTQIIQQHNTGGRKRTIHCYFIVCFFQSYFILSSLVYTLVLLCQQNVFQIQTLSVECISNTDFVSRMYFKYRLCQQSVFQIQTLSVECISNTDFVSRMYFKYRLCQQNVIQIQTLSVECILNTDFVSRMYFKYRLCQQNVFEIQTLSVECI